MKPFFSGCLTLAAASICTLAHADDGSQLETGSEVDTLLVTAQRLDMARSQLMAETGSSQYRFDAADIAALPQGDSTPLNEVLLQAPGVVQDSYGQLHVRGDHANLQYRINEVIIPEAISGFGQSLDTRFADQVNLLTGALPAQYGYRTAGIVDIHTKGVDFANSGDLELVTGSHNQQELHGDLGGATRSWNYFASASYLSDDQGIENPTASRDALHDHTEQAKAFGYAAKILDDNSRISLMLGTADNRFEIPNRPGESPSYELPDIAAPASGQLDAKQREQNSFGVLAYQSILGDINYQAALFARDSQVNYSPDPLGDLLYSGVSAHIDRRVQSQGMQLDASDKLNDTHTLRVGFFFSHDNYRSASQSQVLPVDDLGNVGTAPLAIADGASLSGNTGGIYLQDAWQPTAAFTLNYGLRLDKTTGVTDAAQLSPRLGVVYDWSEDTRLHAGYARYFTPPPMETISMASLEKFQHTTNALPTDVNTAVSAERSHYVDAGLTHKLNEAWSLGLDTYYRQVADLQDEGQFGNALIYSAFNYREGRVGGVELNLSYHQDALSGYLNLAAAKAQARDIVSGQYNFDSAELAYISQHWIPLDHDQKLAASAGMTYQWLGLDWAGDLVYGSGMRNGFANGDHLPAYTQVNASLGKKLDTGALGKLELRLTVNNLFDRVYLLRDGTGVGVGAPQYGQRRNLLLSISKQF